MLFGSFSVLRALERALREEGLAVTYRGVIEALRWLRREHGPEWLEIFWVEDSPPRAAASMRGSLEEEEALPMPLDEEPDGKSPPTGDTEATIALRLRNLEDPQYGQIVRESCTLGFALDRGG